MIEPSSESPVPGPDPNHWLQRFTPSEWLAAARNELGHAEVALSRRAYRPGVTHARRAAGMGLNAVLATRMGDTEAPWGRSYMDHIVAVADDAAVPDDVRAAARALRDTRPEAPALLQLGRADLSALVAARTIVDWAATTSAG